MLQVSLSYQRGTFQVQADFTVPNGLTILFGPSGCGKSTLLHLLAGLLHPRQGRIRVGDELFFDSTVSLPPQQRRLGYVFQPVGLFPHLRVRQNILFAVDRWPRPQQQQRLEELLDLLHLEGLTERYPHQLSGGQAQRVALARALAPRPRLLLLDEPFTGLETSLREALGEELQQLQRRLNLPMVLVTHLRAEALALGDTAILMEAGRVRAVGVPGEILVNSGPRLSSHSQFSW